MANSGGGPKAAVEETLNSPQDAYPAGAAAELLEACREAFEYVRSQACSVIERGSVIGKDGNPVPGTLDPLTAQGLETECILMARLACAIARAEGESWAQ